MFQNLQGTFHQTAPAAARRAHQPPGPGGLRLARGGAEKLQADPRPHLALAGNFVNVHNLFVKASGVLGHAPSTKIVQFSRLSDRFRLSIHLPPKSLWVAEAHSS